ncbi:MAG: FliA/WhiG family RNA polymerase sigma factor [Solirubrobacteraceae bacterium]
MREYRRTQDRRLRDRLILTLAAMVKYVVYRKISQISSHFDADDFISVGIEALIRAIDRFDVDRAVALESFVWTRVQGAVIDELRRQDWTPRSVRRTETRYRRVREDFVSRYGRDPSPQEAADLMGMGVEELHAHELDVMMGELASLDVPVRLEHGATVDRVETLASSDRTDDPEAAAARQDGARRLREAIGALDAREQTIAVLLYVEELTLREVGAVVGLSEGRVCQIHRELRGKLRGELGADAELFAPEG